jgi:hypothetical protein
MSENTEKKQSTKYKKGQSGNPAGRPKGSLNQTTLACQELLDGEAEAITRKAVEKALAGDLTAIRLCLERIIPPRKERPIFIDLPKMAKYRDMKQFTEALLEAVKNGNLTIDEAQGIIDIGKKVQLYLPNDWSEGLFPE